MHLVPTGGGQAGGGAGLCPLRFHEITTRCATPIRLFCRRCRAEISGMRPETKDSVFTIRTIFGGQEPGQEPPWSAKKRDQK